jgi:hypothetical protein
MKNLKGVLAGVLLACATFMQAQTNAKNNIPKAVLNYNPDKTGTGKIVYNSSFLIYDQHLSDLEKNLVVERLINSDASFKEIRFLDANGTKDMMVILQVEADDLDALSQKIRLLVERAGVHNIQYNNELVSLEKFRL